MIQNRTPDTPPASFSGEKPLQQPTPEIAQSSAETQPTTFNILSLLQASWQANGDAHELPLREGDQYVLLSNPLDIHSVLTDKNFSEKGPLYRGVDKILGKGILTTSGAPWKESRRHIVPSFQPKQVNGMIAAMGEVADDFTAQLRTRANDKLIDLQKEMATLTLDTFRVTLFGNNIDAEDLPSYDTLNRAFNLAGNLGGVPGDKERIRAERTAIYESLHATTQALVEKARKEEPDGTLLSMLIHSTDKETGKPLDDETICSELLIMIFAGHETSALTLTWLFQTLKDHPEVTARMQHEVDTLLEGRRPQLDDLSNLVYTRQVIDEVLRLTPTVPLLARSAKEETKIQNIAIQPEGIVLPFIWAAHRHPDFWDKPETFDPDRFSAENSVGRDKRLYMPFAAGNRICIGKGMALAELVTHTTVLLQDFDIAVEPNTITPEAQITLRPNDTIYARVHPR